MAAGGRGDKRFVRLEKSSFPEDVNGRPRDEVLVASSAFLKRQLEERRGEKYAQDGMAAAALQSRKRAQEFSKNLDIAESGPSALRSALMKKHATSSASSPFISGTPEFTTGSGGQLSYMKKNLDRGNTQIVNIYQTNRAIENPTNKAENELLLPTGARRDERIGALHVAPPISDERGKKTVKPFFVDMSGEKPKLYVGRAAVARFKDLSQK